MAFEEKDIRTCYSFEKLPENVRQIGEQPEKGRVYFEDYVVTYMRQIFEKNTGQAVVVFVGKSGEGETQGVQFLYGAIETRVELSKGLDGFSADWWQHVCQEVHGNFPEGQVMGWGIGVAMWNDQMKRIVQEVQRKYFSGRGQIFFYMDMSEQEEALWKWQDHTLQQISGYMVYYGRNPWMQEYMLQGQPKPSFEAAYQEPVMKNVRKVIQKKEEHQGIKKAAVYVTGCILVVLSVLGANLLMQSNQKIETMEKNIAVLSEAATEKNEEKITASPDSIKGSSDNSKIQEVFQNEAEQEKDGEKVTPGAIPSQTPAKTPSQTLSQTPTIERRNETTPKVTKKPVEKSTNDSKESTVTTKKRGNKVSMGRQKASYIVKKGDTLSQIVWRQYRTMECLKIVKKANHIKNEDEIQVGERIILPAYK